MKKILIFTGNLLACIGIANGAIRDGTAVSRTKSEKNIELLVDEIEVIKKQVKPTSIVGIDLGIKDLVDKIVEVIPPPVGDEKEALQALIFDSIFDFNKNILEKAITGYNFKVTPAKVGRLRLTVKDWALWLKTSLKKNRPAL